MALIGYARVSTADQDTAPQLDALLANGCVTIHEDIASGGSRKRPNLQKALASIHPGDTLVVLRIDRLARSLSHLLEIVEDLRAKGAHFKSLGDPIDTTSAQGMLMMQLLGAFAEFERALIRERTAAGIKVARERGARFGNPGLLDGKAEAREAISVALKHYHRSRLLLGHETWLPTVEAMRPSFPWGIVTRVLPTLVPAAPAFTERRLSRTCAVLAAEGLANPAIMAHSSAIPVRKRAARLIALRQTLTPDIEDREVARWLSEDLREPTPHGGVRWSEAMVRKIMPPISESPTAPCASP